MRGVVANLTEEFNAGRIVGKEYASTYVGAIGAVLQQSMMFALQNQEADKKADLISQQIINAASQDTLIIKQQTKTDAEIALLTAKKFTEEAQIKDTVDGSSVVGVLGKQKALFTAQTDGFARDAEQKLLKQVLDTWSVRRTTDTGTLVTANGLSDTNIKSIMDKARVGVGLTASV
jgi:hypothetical protein